VKQAVGMRTGFAYVTGFCEHGNEPNGSIKVGGFLDQLRSS
jgi:hypothetical protein